MKVCLTCGRRFERTDWRCPACGKTPEVRNGYLSFSPDPGDASHDFSPAYFPQLATLEAGHFWFTSRNALLIWALHRFFPKATSFLEIGCGTGFVLSGVSDAFPQLILSGSDIFGEALTFTKKRTPEVSLYQMDARRITFENEFDVIGAFDVLEHIQEDERVLKQLFQAVKTGGGIILTVPRHPFLWSRVDELAFHKRRYTKRELVQKLTEAGFVDMWLTSFVSFLLPLVLVTRILKRRRGAKLDVFQELKINAYLNRVLSGVMRVEVSLIRAGLTFPAGGSMLVVARRK